MHRLLIATIGWMLLAACAGSAQEAPYTPAPKPPAAPEPPSPTAAAAPSALPSATQPVVDYPGDMTAEQKWSIIRRALGRGEMRDNVLAITVPRTDLDVMQTEIGDVPTAAGIESSFRFFLCPCGKVSVLGQFCLVDYEVNDVVDGLRAAGIQVASIAPMMLSEKPRLVLVRLQGQGTPATLANGIRKALSYTAEERMSPMLTPQQLKEGEK